MSYDQDLAHLIDYQAIFLPSPDNQAGKKYIITSHIGLIDYRQNFNALTI